MLAAPFATAAVALLLRRRLRLVAVVTGRSVRPRALRRARPRGPRFDERPPVVAPPAGLLDRVLAALRDAGWPRTDHIRTRPPESIKDDRDHEVCPSHLRHT